MSTTINKRLVDEVMDLYVDWRELCLDVQRAYDRWNGAPRSQAGVTFRDYQDALVREEHASLRYAVLVGCSVA